MLSGDTNTHLRIQMKQAKLLTNAEQKRIYAIIDAHRYSIRNRAIFACSFFAGLRACEIAALRVGDVFNAEGSERWSRNFGPVVKVDRMMRVTIQNEETKEPFARIQSQGCA
jgi:integrase